MKISILKSMLAVSAMVAPLTGCEDKYIAVAINNSEAIDQLREDFLSKLQQIQRELFDQEDYVHPVINDTKFCIKSQYPVSFGLSYEFNEFTIDFLHDLTSDSIQDISATIKENDETIYTIQGGFVFNADQEMVAEGYRVITYTHNDENLFCLTEI